MSNPIFEKSQCSQISNLSSMYKNPMSFLTQMANGNPMIAQTVNLIRCGANPQQLFYDLAKQKGINPEQFLQLVKDNIR